ncbi:MAG: DEAD/DEAH box helicase [Candidatus Asgardarchaeia archaeon]
MSFEELNVGNGTLSAIHTMGYEKPSPIQKETIPLILSGRDVVGQARSGSGKTAAFGIPLVEMTDVADRNVQALILTPTRELAEQVAREIARIGRKRSVRICAIYGGMPIKPQIRKLRGGMHIVVGTPGRILDHLRRRTLNLHDVRVVVLDEADRMLDMGFIDDISTILFHAKNREQTLLFSATMPYEVINLSRKYMKDPITVKISRDELVVEHISQYYVETTPENKLRTLKRILNEHRGMKILVFCATKRKTNRIARKLKRSKYFVFCLNGDMTQGQRNRSMESFRKPGSKILVATDVASRGIDVPTTDLVINFDIPRNLKDYVHRIGRAGRFDRRGKAITIITRRDHSFLRRISRTNKMKRYYSKK